MMSIALIGANGYIGSALYSALLARNSELKNEDLLFVIPVTRQNYIKAMEGKYHIVINCAMNGKRYWANQNPVLDYIETVDKTKHIISNWNYNKLIQISSVSARCDIHSVYGKNKLIAEIACRELRYSLVVRLTSTYGDTISRGVLVDMLNGKAWVSSDSQYAFSELNFITNWIATHINDEGLVELGARNTITLKEIADTVGLKVVFDGKPETQKILDPAPEFPDAYDVIPFMKKRMLQHGKKM